MARNLYLADGINIAWDEVVRPWFENTHNKIWQNSCFNIVLAPTLAQANFLKFKLLEENISCLGVEFFNPGLLRNFLAKQTVLQEQNVSREDIKLLISKIAAQYRDFIAQSISDDPDKFLRVYDQLISSGFEDEKFELNVVNDIIQELGNFLHKSSIVTLEKLDRSIYDIIQNSDSIKYNVLIYGFNESHWHLAQLLFNTIYSSENFDVCLFHGTDQQSGMTWLGTWEENFGEFNYLNDAQHNKDFKSLAENYYFKSGICELDPQVNYRISSNINDESDSVVQQCLEYLADCSCGRIGIIFPSNSILYREVIIRFKKLGISYDDNIGYSSVLSNEHQLLNSWIDYQKSPKLSSLINFIRTRRVEGLQTNADVENIEKELSYAFEQTGIDNISILEAFLEIDKPDCQALKFLKTYCLLPVNNSFKLFLELLIKIFNENNWLKIIDDQIKNALSFADFMDGDISKDIFIKWLKDLVDLGRRSRDDSGKHPFSRIHLMTLDQAYGQYFSHLIITGLNKTNWQAECKSNPLLLDKKIESLNQKIIKQSKSGSGQICVKNNYSFLLCNSDYQLLSEFFFSQLIANTESGITVTSSLTDLDQLSLSQSAISDKLTKLHWVEKGELLSNSIIARINSETNAWLKCSVVNSEKSIDEVEFDQLKLVHSIRRDRDKIFGEYEFSYPSDRRPPDDRLKLSSKQWEYTLTQPSNVWIESILKIKKIKTYEVQQSWSLVIGNWVHSWLLIFSDNKFIKKSNDNFIQNQLDKKSQEILNKVLLSYKKMNRQLPDWWVSKWNIAHQIANYFALQLQSFDDWPLLLSEYTLPRLSKCVISDTVSIPITGRIDMLLCGKGNGKITQKFDVDNSIVNFSDDPVWIIDFKTGGDSSLKKSSIKKGKGLQLILYGLALKSMGFQDISMSILLPNNSIEPQIHISDLEILDELCRAISNILNKGILGIKGPMKNEYNYSLNYPLATLTIDDEILSEKWKISHPYLN